MNFSRTTVLAAFALSLALPTAQSFGATTRRSTSLGTERNRTAGGTNAVKLSVMYASSIGAAKEIVGSIYNRNVAYLNPTYGYQMHASDLRTMLTDGYKIPTSLPPELAAEADAIHVKPWVAGEPHNLSVRLAGAVGRRLDLQADALVHNANRLHTKGEITDAARDHAHEIGGYWKQTAKYFAESEKVLVKNRVTVELDK